MEFWLSFIFGSLQGWLCISTFIISGCTWFLSFLLLVMLTLLGGRADPDGQNISVLDSNKCQLSQLSWWLSSVKASEVQKHCPQQWHQNRFFLTSVRGSVLRGLPHLLQGSVKLLKVVSLQDKDIATTPWCLWCRSCIYQYRKSTSRLTGIHHRGGDPLVHTRLFILCLKTRAWIGNSCAVKGPGRWPAWPQHGVTSREEFHLSIQSSLDCTCWSITSETPEFM